MGLQMAYFCHRDSVCQNPNVYMPGKRGRTNWIDYLPRWIDYLKEIAGLSLQELSPFEGRTFFEVSHKFEVI